MPVPDPMFARVLAIVERAVGPGRQQRDVTPDTPLSDGFWLDSAELLNVVLACEREFGIVFDGERDFSRETFATLGTLTALVRDKTERRQPGS